MSEILAYLREDETEFRKPKRRQRRKTNRTNNLRRCTPTTSIPTKQAISVCSLVNEIVSLEKEIANSVFVLESVGCLNELKLDIEKVICYGLGGFHSFNSKYQAAFLRILQNTFSLKVEVCDPCFVDSDKEVANLLDFAVFESDEVELKVAESPTIFFLPHCHYIINHNLLFANWVNLKNVLLIGNSFLEYIDRKESTINDLIHHVSAIGCSEKRLHVCPGNQCQETNTLFRPFGGTSFITFNKYSPLSAEFHPKSLPKYKI
eukprot:TRINITY_DN774271_c0_g1_i1.p1 TRINITY_DN774271_c0_g1~~TRINITY_DN774271_c0_g1_i1.p1  ORF type:complete len:280 (-),score=41.00 TRINITY_DN774271_c0_g1_i1:162-947(-)